LLRKERIGAPEPRFAVVLNGVPANAVEPGSKAPNRKKTRDEMNVPANALVIGSVVRLAEGKGLEDLLDAFALLARSHDQLHLMLVGEGPLRDSLEAFTRQHQIADRVRFVGYRANPIPYLDGMDLFVLPVPAGSMSIALLEAMMRGLPSMITFCGPEEAVIDGYSGYCAAPGDPEQLALAIRDALADEDALSRVGEQGSQHVQQHFSIRRVADDTLAIYQSPRGDVPLRLRLSSPPSAFPGKADMKPPIQTCVPEK
jgi:glycosyltransferase involved in cell wall biosynthesis